MVIRKGELRLSHVKRDWPICIVVPRDLWGPLIPWMGRHTALRGQGSIDDNGEQLVVLYLRDPLIADRIIRFCDGWRFDAKHFKPGSGKRVICRPVEQTLHVGPDVSRSQRRPFWPPPTDRQRGTFAISAD